jgi:hypothetical protein
MLLFEELDPPVLPLDGAEKSVFPPVEVELASSYTLTVFGPSVPTNAPLCKDRVPGREGKTFRAEVAVTVGRRVIGYEFDPNALTATTIVRPFQVN